MRKINVLLLPAIPAVGCTGITNEAVQTGPGAFLIANHRTMG